MGCLSLLVINLILKNSYSRLFYNNGFIYEISIKHTLNSWFMGFYQSYIPENMWAKFMRIHSFAWLSLCPGNLCWNLFSCYLLDINPIIFSRDYLFGLYCIMFGCCSLNVWCIRTYKTDSVYLITLKVYAIFRMFSYIRICVDAGSWRDRDRSKIPKWFHQSAGKYHCLKELFILK